MGIEATNGERRPAVARIPRVLGHVTLRAFRIAAYAEGGLLPAILVVAVVHWLTGAGDLAVAVVGTLHGAAFTAYVLLALCVSRARHWSRHTITIALSVAFVPFAPWSFERRVRTEGSET